MPQPKYTIGGAKKSTLDDTLLLCVSPGESKQLFSVNLGTQEAQSVSLKVEKKIDNKIKREEFKVSQLLDSEVHRNKWHFDNDTAEIYRRQMVPFYLLEVESNKYPVYVDNSNINQSLTSDYKIQNVNVHISFSVFQTLRQAQAHASHNPTIHSQRAQSGSTMNKNGRPSASSGANQQPGVEHMETTINLTNISLLSTADKIIKICEKQIEKQVEKKLGISFKSTNSIQILKFKDVDSFLYGETQLIYFVEIRDWLRRKNKNGGYDLDLISLSMDQVGGNPLNQTNPTGTLAAVQEVTERSTTRKSDAFPSMVNTGAHSFHHHAHGHSHQAQQFEFPPMIIRNTNHGHRTKYLDSTFGSPNGGDPLNTSVQTQKTMRLDLSKTVETHKENQYMRQPDPRGRSSQQAKSGNPIGLTSLKSTPASGRGLSLEPPSLSSHQSHMEHKSSQLSSMNEKRRKSQITFLQSQPSASFLLKPEKIEKQIQHAAAEKYKHVSIFNWYPPKNLTSAAKSTGQQAPVPYSQTLSKSEVGQRMRNLGNYNNLHVQKAGLIPYHSDDTLASCNINVPFKINLLSFQNLARKLQEQLKKPEQVFEMPQITYRTQATVQHSLVSQLFKDIAQAHKIGDQLSIPEKETLPTHPFHNEGINRQFQAKLQEILMKKPQDKKAKKVFTMKPGQVQIQAALYLGCRRISCFSYSQCINFSNNIDCSGVAMQFWKPNKASETLWRQKEFAEDIMKEEEQGEPIQIGCLPSCTRVCVNMIILPEPGSCKMVKQDRVYGKSVIREGFVLGSCSVSLFDESFLLRQGKRDIRLWPFEAFNPRMVCLGECFMKKNPGEKVNEDLIHQSMSMQIQFMSFPTKVGWCLGGKSPNQANSDNSGQANKLQKKTTDNLSKSLGNVASAGKHRGTVRQPLNQDHNLDDETEALKQVKLLLDAYPLDLQEEDAARITIKTVLDYRNYIHKLPILIKLIDFTDHDKIRICYESLETSGLAQDMSPEEALALLDGQFGDITVRIFAVKKLSMLTDSQIALFMPQLIQALKYELFHQSPLAEFLLEKALNNTRVVGHAFFWALKANLSWPHSKERFFLILERFLMCCGQFKNDLFKQNLVNKSLISLSAFVNNKIDNEKQSKKATVKQMHEMLKKEEIKIKLLQQLIIAHAQFDDKSLSSNCSPSQTEESKALADSDGPDKDHPLNSKRALQQNRKLSVKSGHSSGGEGYQSSNQVSNKQIRPDVYIFDSEQINLFVEEQAKIIFEEKKEAFTSPSKQLLNYQEQELDWKKELIYIPFAPKNPLSAFAEKGGTIFMSKKKPLLIAAFKATQKQSEALLMTKNQNSQTQEQDKSRQLIEAPESQQMREKDEEEEQPKLMKFIFKCGDDLRQDNLVLQFFKIMDRLWQSTDLDYQMVCYDVMESGFETGYIEFIDDATVITDMHKQENFIAGSFRRTSITNYFMDSIGTERHFTEARKPDVIKRRLEEYHDNFKKSFAGQCVATYVLGIRDRHPGNFMLHKPSGRFFHIDFGHFLGHNKKKIGFTRDREPFIYSDELHHFLKYFFLIQPTQIGPLALSEDQLKHQKTDSQQLATMNSRREGNQITTDYEEQYSRHGTMQVQDKQEENKKDKADDNETSSYPMKYKLTLDNFLTASPEQQQKAAWHEDRFETIASRAFLKLRQNADIFINLLILMLVAGLEELNLNSILFVKQAMFLDVSEEEATVAFKQVIDVARKQWYRQFDNLFHVISDYKKEKKQSKAEKMKEKT